MVTYRRNLLIALTCLVGLTVSAPAGAAGPLTWEDIRTLKRQRKSYSNIVEIMKVRGLAFEIDGLEERKLRAYGFSGRHVAEIRRIPAGGKTDVGTAPAGGAREDVVAKPVTPLPPPKLALDPQTEAEHKLLYDQVGRMIDASEVLFQRHPSTHITLIANKEIAARFLPDIARVEIQLRQRFHEPIASGVDLRAANIALLENQYEFEKWTRALFKVFKEDGYEFQAEDPAKQALAGQSFLVRGIYSVCLGKMKQEEARRRVAFAVGFQYFEQLTRYQGPDGLATGFGNLAETILFKHPSMMVKSGYMDRQLAGISRVWSELVRERFARGKIGSVQNVLAYTMGGMEPPDYAEAWSLTSFLAARPEPFAKLVKALPGSDDAWSTISAVYGMDEPTMIAQWKQFATGQR